MWYLILNICLNKRKCPGSYSNFFFLGNQAKTANGKFRQILMPLGFKSSSPWPRRDLKAWIIELMQEKKSCLDEKMTTTRWKDAQALKRRLIGVLRSKMPLELQEFSMLLRKAQVALKSPTKSSRWPRIAFSAIVVSVAVISNIITFGLWFRRRNSKRYGSLTIKLEIEK